MITDHIEYHDGETVLEGYLAYQQTNTQQPLVLVAHDWSGRRQFACDAAERIADMGYIGFALDMYGKGVFGTDGDIEVNSALMNPLAEDRLVLRQRVRAALVLRRVHDRVQLDAVSHRDHVLGLVVALSQVRWVILGSVQIRGLVGILAPGDDARGHREHGSPWGAGSATNDHARPPWWLRPSYHVPATGAPHLH